MISDWNALTIAVLANLPGYVAITFWSRQRTWQAPSTELRTLLQALPWSVAVHAVTLPMIWNLLWQPLAATIQTDALRLVAWTLFTVLVAPALLGVVVARLSDWLFIPNPRKLVAMRRRFNAFVLPAAPPNLWDWWLKDASPDGRFIRITMRDGSRLGGVYSEGSKGTTSPERAGIFLASEWILSAEGDFLAEVPGTRGLLIPDAADILHVRVLSTLEVHEEEVDA